MKIADLLKVPDTSEHDARVLNKGLRNALLAIAAGAGAYILAAVITFWRR